MEGQRLQNEKSFAEMLKAPKETCRLVSLLFCSYACIRAHETFLFTFRTETDFRPPETCPPTSCLPLSGKELGSQYFPMPLPIPLGLSVCPTRSKQGIHPAI